MSNQQSDEHFRLIAEALRASAHGIAILTPALDGSGPRVAFVNDGFCAMYRRTREEVVGQTPVILGIVERQEAILSDLLDHIFDVEPFDAEVTVRRKDGSEFELDLELMPVEEGGDVTHWVAFLRDVTDVKTQVATLRHQSTHDSLTDLPNRVLLLDRLDRIIDTARRRSSRIALLVMDLDRFKDINDTFGHHFGDALLKEVAARLQGRLSSDDLVARLGGDEFGIVVTDAVDTNAVIATARRLISALQEPLNVQGQVLEVGASIGITIYPQHGRDAATLLRRADMAMYAAKGAQTGYAFHSPEMESRSPEELSLIVEMRAAIERNEFELYYQPKLHLRSGVVTRAEVLVRWRHPQRGMLPPGAFIPMAERSGLIKPLTDWIFNRALQQVNEWQQSSVPVHLAVNLSARSLVEQTLPSKIHGWLEKWNVDPRFLKIEITESSIMSDPAHALAVMSLLQSLGVRLSIDDFGTGYSSLSHLRQLPIDEIKVDKSFVFGMTNNEADMSIVRTVIDLGHNLGKQVCAEGVEDEATWRLLDEMKCDLAQGYWISRPVSASDLIHWLVDTAWGMKVLPTRSSQSAAR